MNTYFTQCTTIEEAKALYRQLLKEYHPDIMGEEGTALTAEIISQFKTFTAMCYRTTAGEYFDNSEKEEPEDYTPFTDILDKILFFDDMKIEIIGFWIYCFDSFLYKDALRDLGFWFSSKHKAWVFSGSKKARVWSKKSLDDIRDEKGSTEVQTKKRAKIEA